MRAIDRSHPTSVSCRPEVEPSPRPHPHPQVAKLTSEWSEWVGLLALGARKLRARADAGEDSARLGGGAVSDAPPADGAADARLAAGV